MNFQNNLNAFENSILRMSRCAMSAGNRIQKTKREAYAAAVAFKTMADADQGELVNTIRAAGVRGHSLVDQFLDRKFAQYALIGEDYHEVLSAVNDGMTLKQFLAASAGAFRCQLKREKRDSLASAATPPEPKESASPIEQARRWKEIAQSERAKRIKLEAQVREVKAELRAEVKRLNSGLRRLIA